MTTIFQLTRDDIINAAYRKLAVLGEGQNATQAQLFTGQQALNAIVATFQTLGMALWARKELNISPVVGRSDYAIGVGQVINVPFPLHVYNAQLILTNNKSQIEVEIMARQDFNNLPIASNGTIVNGTYQPFINYGVFSVWPTPDVTTPIGTILKLTYQTPFNYFNFATDLMDFPQEWTNALIYQLACSLAPEIGLPTQDKADLRADAKMHLETVLSNGTEDGSVFFGKDWAGSGQH